MYAIQFDFASDWKCYAGLHKGAFGWAPSLATALTYADRQTAENVLTNAYGKAAAFGRVVEVKQTAAA